MNIQQALAKKTWAVLGATDKTQKFGYKIYKHLEAHAYEVYPVNPRLTSIDGALCYKNLKSLPKVPDVVVFVVPEAAGLQALDECKELGISVVWLQPGADTMPVIIKGTMLGLEVLTACVLVELQ